MCNKVIILWFFASVLVMKLNAELPHDCRVDDNEWITEDLTFSVTDNEDLGQTRIFDTINIKAVKIAENEYVKVDFKEETNELTFLLEPGFNDYVQNENGLKYNISLSIVCNSLEEGNARVLLLVTESRNYDPKFESDDYTFKLSMPISANTEIPETKIIATDANIAPQNLVFSFTSGECKEYFDFTPSHKIDKQYSTQLKTSKGVEIDHNITCAIQVLDKEKAKDVSSMNIQVDVENSKVPNPVFESPLYQTSYVSENLIIETTLFNKNFEPNSAILESSEGYEDHFSIKIDNSRITVSLIRPIPEFEEKKKAFIALILTTTYKDADRSGKTVILIESEMDLGTTSTSTACPTTTTMVTEPTTTCPPCECTTPDPGTTTECPPCLTTPESEETCPPVTECPSFPTTLAPGETCPPVTECPTTPESPQCPTTLAPGETCPPVTDCPICPTTLGPGETCPTTTECTECPNSTTTPINPTTCPTLPEQHVTFVKKIDYIQKDPNYLGFVDQFKARSTIEETIKYRISHLSSTTRNSIEDLFVIDNEGNIEIKSKLEKGLYKLTLKAKGLTSESEDTALAVIEVSTIVNQCDDGSISLDYCLKVYQIQENDVIKNLLTATDDVEFEFHSDNTNDRDWFQISNNGDLQVKTLDREDKNVVDDQIQVKIKAKLKTDRQIYYYNELNYTTSFHKYVSFHDEAASCINIKDIENVKDEIIVAVKILDANDQDPIFVEQDPLVVGYPTGKLTEFLAPPYLIQVTATDADIGIHAKIKYSIANPKLLIDSESGKIFLREELPDKYEFIVLAEDNNGMNGRKANLTIKVLELKEEHISIITIKNQKFSDIDSIVENISNKVNKKVKYLSTTAVPKRKEEEKTLSLYTTEENLPAVRLVLYCFDKKENIVLAKEFVKLVNESGINESIDIKEYETPITEEDATGWVAAVSTLSVLLAIVLIGGIVGYMIYIRPKLLATTSMTSDSPTSHFVKNSHDNPYASEPQMEPAVSERRPTGYPMGFNYDEEGIDNPIYNDLTSDQEETSSTSSSSSSNKSSSSEEEINKENDNVSTGTPRKKSIKFDVNVTEIEIESSHV